MLEAADKPGGGSRTDETIPGYLFNTHAAAHNIINMTRIPAELDLAWAGLEYLPMDPFATEFFRDGRVVRFQIASPCPGRSTPPLPSPRSSSGARAT